MADTHTLPTSPTELPMSGVKGILRGLGARDAFGNPAPPQTGRVVIQPKNTPEKHGYIYFRHGRVYAVAYTGFTPPLARRIYTAGLINENEYDELSALKPEEIGPYAVSHGYLTEDALEDIDRQMLLSSLTHMYTWHDTQWWWEEDELTESFVISPLEPSLVVAATEERQGQWDALARNYPEVTEADAVPLPGPGWSDRAGEDISPELETILTHIDGTNTVAYIAGACGLTRFELAGRLAKAIADDILIFAPEEGSAEEVDAREVLEAYQDAVYELQDAREEVIAAEQRIEKIVAYMEANGLAVPDLT